MRRRTLLSTFQRLLAARSPVLSLSEQLFVSRAGYGEVKGHAVRWGRSGERDLPSLCVGAQLTGADDQHSGGVHPVQSHLGVQAEAGGQVLQVGP